MASKINLGNIKFSHKKKNTYLKTGNGFKRNLNRKDDSFLKDSIFIEENTGSTRDVISLNAIEEQNPKLIKNNFDKINYPKDIKEESEKLETLNPLIDKQSIAKIKNKKNRWKKNFFILLLFLLVGGGAFGGIKVIDAKNNLFKSGIDVNINPVDAIHNIIIPPAEPQLYKSGNSTNILFVGIDSREKNGLQGNTDSLEIASYNYDTNKITMISIPRDTRVIYHVGKNNNTPIADRINAAYYVADSYKYPGGGLALLRSAIFSITNININYTIQINFNAFKEIVNKIGGISVNVENTFTDYTYPNDTDSGVITVHFNKGIQTMDGAKALQYSRSRHSLDNNEGLDFSRAKRQQKVIVAIEEKIKTAGIITNISQLSDFIQIFSNNVLLEKTLNSNSATEKLNNTDLDAILHLKDKADTKNITNAVLDWYIGGINTIIASVPNIEASEIGPVLGQGKFEKVIEYTNFILNTPKLYEENRAPDEDNKIGVFDNGKGYSSTNLEVEKLRSTFILAQYAGKLTSSIVVQAADPSTSSLAQNLSGVGIYDITQKKPNTKAFLKSKYGAVELLPSQVPESVKILSKGYDMILIFPK